VTNQNSISYYYRLATEKATFYRALRVSLVVGIILTLINHPQIIKYFSFSGLDMVQVMLTFIVPFAVSTYSSIMSHVKMKKESISND
jgi:hypothetical protein